MVNVDDRWMRLALQEAEAAMEHGEIPIASVLVAGTKEVTRAQTQVRRRDSIVAHGELFALLTAKSGIYGAEGPLGIYTTVEPCVMCLGAAMQAGLEFIVYGMGAAPDGGARYVGAIREGGQSVPDVVSGVLVTEEVALMRRFVQEHRDSPAIPYVQALLEPYEPSRRP